MKKMSVIIPCYNVEKEIDRCVQSLIDQTMPMTEMEFIFVDDASLDGTMRKLSEWEARYPDSIMVVHCEKNGKQGKARNIGMQYANGEYIGFVDSDDYVDKNMFSEMYQTAVKHKCDMVGCLFVREEEDGTVVFRAEDRKDAGKKIVLHSVNDRKKIMELGFLSGVWSAIYSRSLLLENQLWFPENIQYEDNYWGAFVIQTVSSYYIINKPFYHYVIRNDSTIMQKDSLHHLDRLVIELMKVEEYKKRGLFEIYHDEIEYGFLKMYFINTIRILFVRFTKIPYEIIYSMQDNVKELFPNYKTNPYICQLPPLQQELLKIVEVPLTEEKIEVLAREYCRVVLEWQKNGGK